MVRGICHIVGAGELFGGISPENGDLLIAADGGLDHLLSLGMNPHLVIGDMDSVSSIPAGVKLIRHPVKKDYTDTYLAYKYGKEKGYSKFVIYGGTGGREDHTFANYCLLLDGKINGDDVILIGEKNKTYVAMNEKIKVQGKAGQGISVFAFGGMAFGVCIRGLTYEAEGVDLKPEFPLGVSNSFTESGCGEIEVRRGALLIMEEI